jgi:hypothetical protein
MSFWKASTSSIDYDEGHLTQEDRVKFESRLKSDLKLQDDLKEVRLIKQLLKTSAPHATPLDPEIFTQRILSKIDRHTPKPSTFWETIISNLQPILNTKSLAWGAAAASLTLALVFGWQSFQSNSKLEALLNNELNETMLFQVASIAFKKSNDQASSRLELSELLEWTGEMDVVNIIDRSGKLPSKKAYKELLSPDTTSDKNRD